MVVIALRGVIWEQRREILSALLCGDADFCQNSRPATTQLLSEHVRFSFFPSHALLMICLNRIVRQALLGQPSQENSLLHQPS
jgi:hypothetical protein